VLNDVLIWVLVPVLSYLAGALFQAGYNHYFGLPDVIVSADPVATFHASRRYLDLIAHHFSSAIAIPLAFLVYLAVLPGAFYRQHAIVVLTLAAAALFISFSIRPFAWAPACGAVLVIIQVLPALERRLRAGAPAGKPRIPQLIATSPTAVKTLAIVAFFYATLFSAGYESARFETQFFVTDRDTRYVMLAINDKDAIAAELLDAHCKRVRSIPSTFEGYHFDEHIKVFTLGDSDTPPFRLYETDGLTSSKSCRRAARSEAAASSIWISDNTRAQGPNRGADAVVHTELAEQADHVGVDRRRRTAQVHGDLGVRVTVDDQPQNSALARREVRGVERGARAQEYLGDLRIEPRRPHRDGLDRLRQVVERRGHQTTRVRAGVQRGPQQRLVDAAFQREHADVGPPRLGRPDEGDARRRDTGLAGQTKIH
jgi:hypothetical protein